MYNKMEKINHEFSECCSDSIYNFSCLEKLKALRSLRRVGILSQRIVAVGAIVCFQELVRTFDMYRFCPDLRSFLHTSTRWYELLIIAINMLRRTMSEAA